MRSGKFLLVAGMLLCGVGDVQGQQADAAAKDAAPWHVAKVATSATARGDQSAASADSAKYLHVQLRFNVSPQASKLHQFRVTDQRGQSVGKLWGWNDARASLVFEGDWGSLAGLYLDGLGHREPLVPAATPASAQTDRSPPRPSDPPPSNRPAAAVAGQPSAAPPTATGDRVAAGRPADRVDVESGPERVIVGQRQGDVVVRDDTPDRVVVRSDGPDRVIIRDGGSTRLHVADGAVGSGGGSGRGGSGIGGGGGKGTGAGKGSAGGNVANSGTGPNPPADTKASDKKETRGKGSNNKAAGDKPASAKGVGDKGSGGKGSGGKGAGEGKSDKGSADKGSGDKGDEAKGAGEKGADEKSAGDQGADEKAPGEKPDGKDSAAKPGESPGQGSGDGSGNGRAAPGGKPGPGEGPGSAPCPAPGAGDVASSQAGSAPGTGSGFGGGPGAGPGVGSGIVSGLGSGGGLGRGLGGPGGLSGRGGPGVGGSLGIEGPGRTIGPGGLVVGGGLGGRVVGPGIVEDSGYGPLAAGSVQQFAPPPPIVPQFVLYISTGDEAGHGKVYQVDDTGRVLGVVSLPYTATGIALHRNNGLILALPRDGGRIMRIDDTGKVATLLEKERTLVHPVDVALAGDSDTVVVADNIADVLAMSTSGGGKPAIYRRFEAQQWQAQEMSIAVATDKHVIFGTDGDKGVYRFFGDSSAATRPLLPELGGVAADPKSLLWAATQQPNRICVFEGEMLLKTLRLPPKKSIYRQGLLSFGPAGCLCVAARASDEAIGQPWLLMVNIEKDEIRSLFPWTREQMVDFVVGPRMIWDRRSPSEYKSLY